jgi:hypothetical protein
MLVPVKIANASFLTTKLTTPSFINGADNFYTSAPKIVSTTTGFNKANAGFLLSIHALLAALFVNRLSHISTPIFLHGSFNNASFIQSNILTIFTLSKPIAT